MDHLQLSFYCITVDGKSGNVLHFSGKRKGMTAMSLDSRLYILAEALKESAEFPDAETKNHAILFGRMLSQHTDLPDSLKTTITQAIRDLAAPRRQGFDLEYERAVIKAAFFFLGIYSVLNPNG